MYQRCLFANKFACSFFSRFLSFIVSFSFYAANPESDGKRVQEFYTTMEDAIRDHPLWAGATDEEVDSALEVKVLDIVFIALLWFQLLWR